MARKVLTSTASAMIAICFLFWITICAVTVSASTKKMTVTTMTEEPWVKLKRNNPTSNDDFDGFIPELLKKIANKIDAEYTLHLVEDGKYGQYNNTSGTWNGMIGEINRGKADVAAAVLTISKERQNAVDFTVPFVTFDYAILLLKTPDGRHEKITSCDDLINQPDMKYGVIKGGLTESIFQKHQEAPYKQMAARMRADPSLNVNNSTEGVKKLRESNGNFALILESPTAEYMASTPPCDLHLVGLKLEQRSYAWGLKKNYELKDSINGAISSLRSSGELDELDRKWRKPNLCSGAAPRFQTTLVQVVRCLCFLVIFFHQSL